MVVHNKPRITVKAIPMIPLTYVSSLDWSKELGQKIRRARGKRSRMAIVNELPENQHRTTQWLENLESGKYRQVDIDVLIEVLKILHLGLEHLYPIVSLDTAISAEVAD